MSEEPMTSERLGANLRAAIKASGLSQDEVAKRCDMEPTALSKALSGNRNISSLELALICTATGTDVLGILEAEPLHGESYRKGLQQGHLDARCVYECGDMDTWLDAEPGEDFTGCGVERDGSYCDLPIHHEGPHHADLFWEETPWTQLTPEAHGIAHAARVATHSAATSPLPRM